MPCSSCPTCGSDVMPMAPSQMGGPALVPAGKEAFPMMGGKKGKRGKKGGFVSIEGLNETGNKIGEGVTGAVTDAARYGAKVIEPTTQGITATASKLVGDTKRTGEKIVGDVTNAVTDTVGKVQNTAVNALDDVSALIKPKQKSMFPSSPQPFVAPPSPSIMGGKAYKKSKKSKKAKGSKKSKKSKKAKGSKKSKKAKRSSKHTGKHGKSRKHRKMKGGDYQKCVRDCEEEYAMDNSPAVDSCISSCKR